MFLNFLTAHIHFSISDFKTLLQFTQSRLIFFHVDNDPNKRFFHGGLKPRDFGF